jgi:hypothetical protein
LTAIPSFSKLLEYLTLPIHRSSNPGPQSSRSEVWTLPHSFLRAWRPRRRAARNRSLTS